ncbi:hypothetical protein EfmAA94_17400 [Enterococcus faecium]|nr:hypothetical protein EfmAA94_17400 [Enterococcus faecium]
MYKLNEIVPVQFFKVFTWILSLVWFLANLVSLYWFVIQYGIKIPIKYKYYPVRLGWLGNRLFGVYTDQTYGADIVCGKTDLRKGIDGLASLIQQEYQLELYEDAVFLFCGNALSGSRTTLVCLLITTFVFSFFTSYSSRFLKTNTLKDG